MGHDMGRALLSEMCAAKLPISECRLPVALQKKLFRSEKPGDRWMGTMTWQRNRAVTGAGDDGCSEARHLFQRGDDVVLHCQRLLAQPPLVGRHVWLGLRPGKGQVEAVHQHLERLLSQRAVHDHQMQHEAQHRPSQLLHQPKTHYFDLQASLRRALKLL